MRKVIWCLILAIFISMGVGGFMVYKTIKNPFSTSEDIQVEVKQGDSLLSILERLKSEDKLNNYTITKFYLKLQAKNVTLSKGTYVVKANSTLKEFLITLSESGLSVQVTIPEGYDIEKIGEELETEDIITKEEFIKAVNEYELPDYIKKDEGERYALEGYLYPDTYTFSKGVKGKEIIDTMLAQFNRIIEDIQTENDIVIRDENLEKIITKASMIEKESRLDKDRPIISSVIDNRMKINMKLRLDATVLYALGKHKEKVYYKDLEVKSPYNTYYVTGYPVGAIASPGKKSIEAAIMPANTDYKFYLLKTDGSNEHYFTNSDVDFEKKKEEYGYKK